MAARAGSGAAMSAISPVAISFISPVFLLGLVLVPVALLGLWLARRRRSRFAVRFPGVPTLAAVLPPVTWRRHVPPALFLVALAVLVAALARPQRTVAVPIERASVVLVMDSSRSMLATDVEPSRIEAAQEAGRSFLDRVPDPLRVGTVAFSDRPHSISPLSDDHGEAEAAIDALNADGGTATGDALASALTLLRSEREGRRRPAPAAIVLLSDGATTRGRDPVPVARQAKAQRVPVYTVALGTETATVPSPDGIGTLPAAPDPETMERIASASGGRAFTAERQDELDDVYERLGSQIGTREAKREVTAGVAGGGLALLLIALGLSLRWSGRLP